MVYDTGSPRIQALITKSENWRDNNILRLFRVVNSAGTKGHILNLGHGVLVGTPEEAVAHFFDVARSFNFDSTVENYAVGAPNMVA